MACLHIRSPVTGIRPPVVHATDRRERRQREIENRLFFVFGGFEFVSVDLTLKKIINQHYRWRRTQLHLGELRIVQSKTDQRERNRKETVAA